MGDKYAEIYAYIWNEKKMSKVYRLGLIIEVHVNDKKDWNWSEVLKERD